MMLRARRLACHAVLMLSASVGMCGLAASAEQPYQKPGGIADLDDPFIIAGYRAIFTCSAHFQMHRPLDDIKKIEQIGRAHV